MKKRTSVLVAVGVLVLLPLVALAIAPMVFGDNIANRAKAAANDALTARLDWRDAGLSLFGDFPNLTLRLDDLTIAGTGRFAADTLTKVRRLAVVLDLGSVVGNFRRDDPIVVRSIELDRPVARLRVLEDGTANWVIVKDTPPSSKSSRPLTISLKQLEIRDG